MFNAGGRTPKIFYVGSVCCLPSVDRAHQFKMLRELTLLQVLGFCMSAIENIAERDKRQMGSTCSLKTDFKVDVS